MLPRHNARGDVRHALYVVLVHVFRNPVGNLKRQIRVREHSGSDADRVSTGDKHLDRVLGARNSAHSENRQTDGVPDLPDHPDRDREHRGTRKSTAVVVKNRAFSLYIDAHSEQGVYQAQSVGSASLRRPRGLGDIGDVRRELHYQRL